jgi:hypothetical protein
MKLLLHPHRPANVAGAGSMERAGEGVIRIVISSKLGKKKG